MMASIVSKRFKKVPALKLSSSSNVPLVLGQKIYKCHIDISDDYSTVTGEVIRSTKNPNLYGIRNLSGKQWTITLPDGSQKLVDDKGTMPIQAGLKIRFSSSNNGEIMI